jgi:DNA gyrase inhibitor GyrI
MQPCEGSGRNYLIWQGFSSRKDDFQPKNLRKDFSLNKEKTEMENLEVRIVQLEPMRVVRAHAFGQGPEHQAWEKLVHWARQHNLTDSSGRGRIFGFNNPNPSAGSPNYGYEFWMTVGPDVEPEGEIGVTEYAGGLYAVTRYQDGKGDDIGGRWQKLIAWVENSPYRPARHQWLEEHLIPLEFNQGTLILDLYMPIKK